MFISRKEYDRLNVLLNQQGKEIEYLKHLCWDQGEAIENLIRRVANVEDDSRKKKEPTYFG